MSVLIKSMEIPRCCDVCAFSGWSNLCQTAFCKVMEYQACFKPYSREYKDKRAEFCPLIEVKELHGRLGDLDELWNRMYNYTDNEGAKMPFGDNDFMIHRDSACELIEDAPTVIEAERNE